MSRVYLLGTSAHPSMTRYAEMLERGFAEVPAFEVHSRFPRDPTAVRPTGRARVGDYLNRWVSYPLQLRRLQADVFHMVEHSAAHLARSMKAPTVVTVHDVIVLRAANGDIPWVGKRWWIWRFKWGTRHLRHADAIVCPSETSRRDVVELCQIDPERVHAIPHTMEGRFRPLPPAEKETARAELPTSASHVVLHLATGGYYKNVATTLRVIAALRAQGVDATLVRVGVGLRAEEAELAQELGIADAVIDLGVVDDTDLVRIYNAADALLFPSFYEGFGWPVLEAMACGTPVVCSDTPALLEVAGDAAAMADATDVEGLVAALGDALGSPGRAEELARAGIARAATFTRSRMIDGHASVYQALAASTT